MESGPGREGRSSHDYKPARQPARKESRETERETKDTRPICTLHTNTSSTTRKLQKFVPGLCLPLSGKRAALLLTLFLSLSAFQKKKKEESLPSRARHRPLQVSDDV